MRLATAGNPSGFDRPVVGVVTLKKLPAGARDKRIFVGESLPDEVSRYRGLLTTSAVETLQLGSPLIHRMREIDHFRDGDIVVMEPGSGFVRSLYRPAEKHNSLFITERCNSNCIMCSQPPKDRDDSEELTKRNLELIDLIDPAPSFLTLTGGEPTLLGEKLFRILGLLRDKMPSTALHMLTNGRRFAWPDFTKQFASVDHPQLSLGIPLYSDIANIHDYVVQAHGAFDQTVIGMHQLARWNQRVEVRVVLHARTVDRLPELAEFIYRNLSFVEHVAFMGLENIGYTPRNIKELWIDPFEYQQHLYDAVLILCQRGIRTSIYNHQLCVLRPSLWRFAQKSISDWKNVYLEECDACAARQNCGGFFKWATNCHSAHVHALSSRDCSSLVES